MCIESIAVFVLSGADFARSSAGVDLKDGVGGTINVRIDAHTEQVLVVVGVDTRINLCAPTFGILAGVHGVGIQDPGEFDLELHGAILVEDPVHCIFVIRRREDVGDEEFAPSCDDHGIVTEIGMFEEDASIFLVDADGILDGLRSSGTIDEMRIHVVDDTFAVATQSEAVGHVAASILTEVEGVLALVRMLRVSVRYHHFSEG